MAYAFGKQEVSTRGLENDVDIITGGTQPADHVHEPVVSAMNERGIDVSDRTPREITFEETAECDYVITMGCAAEDVCPAGWGGDNREWNLADPDGKPPAEVAAIRDDIERRVTDLIDELVPEKTSD